MLKYLDPKLYRKFLILAVLLGGLFMVSFTNPAKASTTFCCSECDVPHMECIADCNAQYPSDPAARWYCIQHICNPAFYWCMQGDDCDPGC
jgi:hypothetical protein